MTKVQLPSAFIVCRFDPTRIPFHSNQCQSSFSISVCQKCKVKFKIWKVWMFIFKGWVVAMVTLNSCKDMFEIGGSLNVQTAYLRNLWNIFVSNIYLIEIRNTEQDWSQIQFILLKWMCLLTLLLFQTDIAESLLHLFKSFPGRNTKNKWHK